jgi:hypothetical protein
MEIKIDKTNKVKLKGVLPRTADWIYFDEKGNLVIEHFDHSSDAENFFGRDVAFLIKINPLQQKRLYKVLNTDDSENGGFFVNLMNWILGDDINELQDKILVLIKDRFTDYYGIQQFLVNQKIKFNKSFDNWA